MRVVICLVFVVQVVEFGYWEDKVSLYSIGGVVKCINCKVIGLCGWNIRFQVNFDYVIYCLKV